MDIDHLVMDSVAPRFIPFTPYACHCCCCCCYMSDCRLPSLKQSGRLSVNFWHCSREQRMRMVAMIREELVSLKS